MSSIVIWSNVRLTDYTKEGRVASLQVRLFKSKNCSFTSSCEDSRVEGVDDDGWDLVGVGLQLRGGHRQRDGQSRHIPVDVALG